MNKNRSRRVRLVIVVLLLVALVLGPTVAYYRVWAPVWRLQERLSPAFELKGWNDEGQLEFVHEKSGIPFVYLPGGRFEMGSPPEDLAASAHEKPVRSVSVGPFLIGKYEVTRGDWVRAGMVDPSFHAAGDRLPVECVTWRDAQEFARGFGLGLPTEAQWEYACRGGATTVYPWGDTFEPHRVQVAGSAVNVSGTARVDEQSANAFGLCGMLGNVSEWCEDNYSADAYRSGDSSNPVFRVAEGDEGPYVLRGGSWFSDAALARCAARDFEPSATRVFYIGFRLAYSLAD